MGRRQSAHAASARAATELAGICGSPRSVASFLWLLRPGSYHQRHGMMGHRMSDWEERHNNNGQYRRRHSSAHLSSSSRRWHQLCQPRRCFLQRHRRCLYPCCDVTSDLLPPPPALLRLKKCNCRSCRSSRGLRSSLPTIQLTSQRQVAGLLCRWVMRVGHIAPVKWCGLWCGFWWVCGTGCPSGLAATRCHLHP